MSARDLRHSRAASSAAGAAGKSSAPTTSFSTTTHASAQRSRAQHHPSASSASFPSATAAAMDDLRPASSAAHARKQSASASSHYHHNHLNSSGNTGTTAAAAATERERRTERRHQLAARETVVTRTTARSPLKSGAMEGRANARRSREEKAERMAGERAAAAGRQQQQQLQKGVEEVKATPWTPQATLIPHTTAPLATRISIPPLASTAPRALEPTPLAQLSLDAQEAAIIEDLLYVFMGFEGQYIRYAETYNPAEEKERLVGPCFRILPGLDPSLRDLTTSMLRMATHYVGVEAFVEVQSREEYGAVNHALCAAIRRLLKDYLILLAQLEHQMLTNPTFTLHLLNLHTKQTGHMLLQLYTMGIELLKANGILEDEQDDDDEDDSDSNDLEDILESLREGGNLGQGSLPGKKICKGGSVLGLITRRLASMSGDPAARTLLTTLLREASRPYMVMLNEWLHQGAIRDPHGEFLIKEQQSIKREKLDQDYTDEYWEKRYTLREALVPPQLDGLKDKVLLAGKYLNVVRECGGVDVSRQRGWGADLPRTFDDPRFLENVNAAYAHANASLLSLLLTTHALPARLRSLKHYFFLDRSDFFTYFLELGASELKKPARAVNVGKLQSLLDIVLRQPGSAAAEDPYKEDVKVQMNEIGLTNWLMKIVSVQGMEQDAASGAAGGGVASFLTPAAGAAAASGAAPPITDDKDIIGFDALVLDYSMPFPLSLVVSRVTLTRYQLLFRYLLSLKHLETLLTNSWLEHSKAGMWKRRSRDGRVESWKRRAYTLRARMLIFVQQMLYYCTAEVIEPNWVGLMERLGDGGVLATTAAGGSAGGSGGGSSGNSRPTTAGVSRPGTSAGAGMSTSFSAAAAAAEDGEGPTAAGGVGEPPKRTVDELMQDHVDFLATCLKECMLTNGKLLRINSKILATCTMFANYTTSLSRYLVAADPSLGGSSSTSPPSSSLSTSSTSPLAAPIDPARLDKMMDVLRRYEENFARHLKILLDTLNYLAATETVVFLSLCARLSTAAGSGGGGGAGAGPGGGGADL